MGDVNCKTMSELTPEQKKYIVFKQSQKNIHFTIKRLQDEGKLAYCLHDHRHIEGNPYNFPKAETIFENLVYSFLDQQIEENQNQIAAEKFLTKFKNYDELPFSKDIQDYLFESHSHNEAGDIIYSEKDVLILLQMQQKEYER